MTNERIGGTGADEALPGVYPERCVLRRVGGRGDGIYRAQRRWKVHYAQIHFGYSELEKLLAKHGFLIYELLTPDDIQRDIIDNAGADMKAFEHVNYCLAVRKG